VVTSSEWENLETKDTNKIYLVSRSDGYYNKKIYNTSTQQWNNTNSVGPE
jgi:hypothetical protein